ncbi:MAG: hypothetical protein PF692_10560 [Kiritimatiellae bacterium]|jgi:hypothetical protein|nr:hypothetical protein [Kiritimatiellia bacterium]
MPEDAKKGKQGGNKKYEDECWKRLYFITGEIKYNGFKLGCGNNWSFSIHQRNVELYTQMMDGVNFLNVAPFLAAHETIEALFACAHLGFVSNENNSYLMESDDINTGWINNNPPAEFHEKTKNRVRHKLKVKGWWKKW